MLDVNRGEAVEVREPPEKLGIFRRSAICLVSRNGCDFSLLLVLRQRLSNDLFAIDCVRALFFVPELLHDGMELSEQPIWL